MNFILLQQYLPFLERVNLSSNRIGAEDIEASTSRQRDRELCLLATAGIKVLL